jgi:type II secretory ATPase GspE/PulE/Tfp pilus assembly ATPase PilB-like protein/FixJ family two-component response regulator
MSRLASLFIGEEKKQKQGIELDVVKSGKTSYKILFVDDEEKVLKAMRRIFRQENYTLFMAQSAQEALKLLKDESVHVIISDHRMPGMTGAELLREIKALYPQTIRIMLTGYADVNAVMGAVNEGAVYKFITKPWNDDDLRLTVSLALEQFDLIQENKSLKKKTDIQKKEISKLSRFASVHRSQLGSILVRQNLIRKEDLDKALSIQSKSKKILPQILVEMGLLDEKTVIKTISSKLGINRVYPNEFTVSKELVSLIPRNICEKNLLLPLKHDGGRLIVAMADPTDYMKVDDLKFIVGLPIEPVLSTHKEIIVKLNEIFGKDDILEAALSEIDLIDPTENIEVILEQEDEETDIDDLISSKDQPPAIRIVNAIISDALRHGASDVHIEPKTKYIMVRYRIDDLLQDKLHIPLSMHLSIVSRIKIMSDLDIAERRRPQDGRVTVKTSSRMVDMRISTLPTINGEKIVLRILDKNAAIKDIDQLGLSEKDYATVCKFIEYPQGIILATGPTGSGKTSTLYSLLRKGAKITKNFTTIEDPVEFHMSMAGQVNVREKIGLGFPIILRSILRQDPNVIMLGEIRDYETAEVAFHAALTGHLVLTTLHTNSSVASITRLRNIGMKAYVISDALVGIIAQRLVRRICPHCKSDDDPSEETLNALKIFEKDFMSKKGSGCEHCNQTGYKGRIGVYEVFQIDGEIKKKIHRDATDTELLESAKQTGMTTLLDDAMLKVKAGITTCEEVLRVFGPQDVLAISCPLCGAHMEERFQWGSYGRTVSVLPVLRRHD